MTFKDYPKWVIIIMMVASTVLYIWKGIKWPFKKLMNLMNLKNNKSTNDGEK